MSEIKHCTECKTIKSAKFRQLKGNKWKEAENNNLVKVTWTEGVVLCNICYMNFVENPLKRGSRRVKTTDEEAEEEEEEEEVSEKIDFTRAIKMIAKIFYEREYNNKGGPIYEFDEMRRLLQEIEPSLRGFFDQLYLGARPFERNEQIMDHMKRLMWCSCVIFLFY